MTVPRRRFALSARQNAPMHASSSQPAAALLPQPLPLIVVVEKDREVRLSLAALLKRQGYAVSTAASVAECAAMLSREVLASGPQLAQPGNGNTARSAMRSLQTPAVTPVPRIAFASSTAPVAFPASASAAPLRIQVGHSMQEPQHVLNGWKEISKHIGRGVRTLQRWERDFGLPVHRPKGCDRAAVLAFPEELDAWMHATPLKKRAERQQKAATEHSAAGKNGAESNPDGATKDATTRLTPGRKIARFLCHNVAAWLPIACALVSSRLI